MKNTDLYLIFHIAICAAGITNSIYFEPNLIFGSKFLRHIVPAEWGLI